MTIKEDVRGENEEDDKVGMKYDPLFNIPALRIVRGKKTILALADLHFGLEYGYLGKGVTVKGRFDESLERIIDILDAIEADKVLLVGDVKDDLFGTGRGTLFQLGMFFDALTERSRKVVMVKGNHDSRIEDILPGHIRLLGPRGGVVDGIGLFHGHSWPRADILKAPLVLTAHNHPTFASVLGGNRYHYHRCWLRGKLDEERVSERFPQADPEKVRRGEFIVMPAFTSMGKGVVVNGDGVFLGPVLANGLLAEENTRVYLLDGTDVGTLGEIRGMIGTDGE